MIDGSVMILNENDPLWWTQRTRNAWWDWVRDVFPIIPQKKWTRPKRPPSWGSIPASRTISLVVNFRVQVEHNPSKWNWALRTSTASRRCTQHTALSMFYESNFRYDLQVGLLSFSFQVIIQGVQQRCFVLQLNIKFLTAQEIPRPHARTDLVIKKICQHLVIKTESLEPNNAPEMHMVVNALSIQGRDDVHYVRVGTKRIQWFL